MSPRTRLGLSALVWASGGFAAAVLPPLLLPWTNWFWLLPLALVGCLIKSVQLADRADKTYGWPMSKAVQAELDRAVQAELDRRYPGWRP